MAYNGQEIFKRIGILVKWFNRLKTLQSDLDGVYSTIITRYNSTRDDRESVVRTGNEVISQQQQSVSLQSSVQRLVEEYITDDLGLTIHSTHASAGEIIGDLIEAMNEAAAPDTVDGNAVSATAPTKDPNNHRGSDGTATTPTATQMARPDNFFDVVCVDDQSVDEELWEVRSSVLNRFSLLTTGKDFQWDEAGIAGLKINSMPIAETGDSGNQVSSWSLRGARRSFGTDPDGKIYVELKKSPTSLVETGDLQASFANWSISGATLDNTDVGSLFVLVQKRPDEYAMTQDDNVILTSWSLTGATRGGNTDPAGKLYVSVTFDSTTYTVSLFKDPQRQNLVARGTTTTTPPEDITLFQENASGLSGSVRLESYSADNNQMELEVPFHFVRLYRSKLRATTPVMAEGVSFAATKMGLTLAAQNNSGLSGSVDLHYGVDDAGTELSVPLHYVRLYPSNPTGLTDDQKQVLLVAHGASTSSSATALRVDSVGGSGLTGQVNLSYSSDTTGIVLQLGWKARDKWKFQTTSDEGGTFQIFFRDNFGVALPAKTDGTETISDSLAE